VNRARVLSLIALILNKLLLTRTICSEFHSDALDSKSGSARGKILETSSLAEYIG
jgi:hypothetical protein